MSERCIQRTMENLRATIAHHEHQYRLALEPEITDTQFDALKLQLQDLQTRYPQYVDAKASNEAVASDLTGTRESVTHLRPMLSLSHTSDLEVVLKEFEPYLLLSTTQGVSVEPKLDGLALSLRYVDGELVVASTRGDGAVGEEVTATVRIMPSIPSRLEGESAGTIEVRGEVVVYRAVFDAYNEEALAQGRRTYTNPRSMAAAAMRLQDPAEAGKLKAQFIAYDVYGLMHGKAPANTPRIHERLNHWGFYAVPASYAKTCEEMKEHIAWIEKERDRYPYDIDGAVVKLVDATLREKLGSNSAHPRWALAFKYPAQEAFAVIEEVVFQTGRTGAITPVVKVTPTPLGGITVKSVTLHNPATLTRMALRLGDTAVIRRANDVIPYFVKALPRGTGPLVAAPTTCASCGSTLVAFGNSGLRCMKAMACPAQAVTALIHFADKSALDIDGLGKERLKALWEAKLVATPADLYRLTVPQLAHTFNLQTAFASKLQMAISASKFTTLPRLLVGLGIEGIGKAMAVNIARAFQYDAMAIFHASAQDFLRVPGMDKVRCRAVERYCAENYESLMDLLNQGLSWPVQSPMPQEAALPLEGKVVVVTGRFEGLSREQLLQYLRDQGATLSTRVAKSTFAVIAGRKGTVHKLTSATALSVPMYSLAEFLAAHHLPDMDISPRSPL